MLTTLDSTVCAVSRTLGHEPVPLHLVVATAVDKPSGSSSGRHCSASIATPQVPAFNRCRQYRYLWWIVLGIPERDQGAVLPSKGRTREGEVGHWLVSEGNDEVRLTA